MIHYDSSANLQEDLTQKLAFFKVFIQMQDFYLIRHGETDWNLKARRFQGHTDIELNEIGVQQAQELKNLIADLKIDLYVTSDLKRAAKTASILSEAKIPIIVDSDLREVHLGSAEGKTPDEIDNHHGPDFRKRWSGFDDDSMDMRYPGGESRREVVDRLTRKIHLYLDQYPDHKIAFVSHGFAIRSFIYSCGIQVKDFFVPNCAVVPFKRRADTKTVLYTGLQDPQALLKPGIKTILP